MSNAANSNRNSRIDILRAVSMLMIVTCHFIYHGIRHVTEGDTFPDLGFSASLTGEINFFFCQLLGYLTNIGPNLFILITGYFLIKPRDFRYALRKALHLWLVIVFYSLASLLAASLLTDGKAFSTQELLACILPVWSRQYWFMTMYLPLLLLSPFLAKGASALIKRDYQWLLLVLLILNFALSGVGYGPVFLGPVPLPFYIFVFLVGGYFRLYGCPARYVQYGIYVYLLGYLALAAAGTVAQLHFAPAGTFPHIKGMANNSITLFMSVLVFAWVITRSQKETRMGQWAINISPYVLAVYLIHDNPLIRPLLWNSLVHPRDYIQQPYLIPYCIVSSIAIFVIGIGIEWLRTTLSGLLSAYITGNHTR